MLNDGAGNFTDMSSLLPTTSGSVYEAEVSDLDNDDDVDLFFVSMTGFQEGPVANDLNPGGSLGFTLGAPESGFVDDNEVVLFDYNGDSTLDVLIGSLGAQERLYRNDNNLSFTEQSSAIQAIADSTLDATVADLDNDGDYDIITAQGESNPAQYANKVYLNSSLPDIFAPTVKDLLVPTSTVTWPVVVKVKYSDQVMDDGEDYVSTTLYAAPVLGTGATVAMNNSGFSTSALNLTIGQSIILTNTRALPAEVRTDKLAYLLFPGQSVEIPVLEAGITPFLDYPSGPTLQVTATGTETAVNGLRMGVGQHRLAIPQLPTSPSDLLWYQLSLRDWRGNSFHLAPAVLSYPVGGVVRYCSPANSNTSGLPGRMDYMGSIVASDQDFSLQASQMPPGEFGFFLGGTDQNFIPNAGGSFGNLCLGGAIARFNGVGQIQNSGTMGSFSLSIPLNAMPFNPNQAATAGSTYTFQAWFRDSLLTSSNFTDALAVTFQ